VLDTYFNQASAPSQGEGVYALLASVKIPLFGPGWNNFAYPVQATQTVTYALLSINGYYTTVYGYVPTDTTDPWRMYDVNVPSLLNDLETLEFGKGYWINVSQEITMHLSSSAEAVSANRKVQVANAESAIPLPPATFYGVINGSAEWSPIAGLQVTAWINGTLCGQGKTLALDDQIIYGVKVLATDMGTYANCGTSGQIVTFQVAGQDMDATAIWDNRQVWQLPLKRAITQLYLPLITRH
jgi:hypothetical protein